MFDISKQEYFELQTIVVAVRNALGNLFSPDLFNYASLGNVFKRLHIHIIPRYKSSRVFCDKVFTDINWGRNYAPYNKNFSVDAEVYDSLKLGFREFGFT
jgi:diadenosine tetraphosphate (Ap4A) HIT family hydrolase